jgi:hypothetical protein
MAKHQIPKHNKYTNWRSDIYDDIRQNVQQYHKPQHFQSQASNVVSSNLL